MKKTCDLLEKVVTIVLIVLGTAMVGVGVMQVVWRYVLEKSLPWSEELLRYMFIWLVLIGISIGIRYKKHVAIDVLQDSLHGMSKLILQLAIGCCCLAMYGLLIKFGGDFVLSTLKMNSSALRIPMWYVNISMPIGGLLAMIFQLEYMLELVRDYRLSLKELSLGKEKSL